MRKGKSLDAQVPLALLIQIASTQKYKPFKKRQWLSYLRVKDNYPRLEENYASLKTSTNTFGLKTYPQAI